MTSQGGTSGPISADPAQDEEGDLGAVQISLGQWDKLKLQMQTVVEENEMLANQEAVLKGTIEELTNQIEDHKFNQSNELCVLNHDKEVLRQQIDVTNKEKQKMTSALKELVEVFSKLDVKHKLKMASMEKMYADLQERHHRLVELSQTKIDLWFHNQQVEMVSKINTSEMTMKKGEINDLRNKLMSINADKLELDMKLTKLEGSSKHYQQVQRLEKQLKEMRTNVAQSEIKVKVATFQELVHRRTIARILEEAEVAPMDVARIADAIRQEHKAKDALTHVYGSISIKQEDCCRTDGDKHDGETRDGGNHDGDNHDGCNHDGDNHDGCNHDGDNHDGDNHDGDNHSGDDYNATKDEIFRFLRDLDDDGTGNYDGDNQRQFRSDNEGENNNNDDVTEEKYGGDNICDEGDHDEDSDYEDAVTVIDAAKRPLVTPR